MIAQVIRNDRMAFLGHSQRLFGSYAARLDCTSSSGSGKMAHGKRFLQTSFKDDGKFCHSSGTGVPPPASSSGSNTTPRWNFQLGRRRQEKQAVGIQKAHDSAFAPLKWSSYAMPSKDTLKEQEQEQEQEAVRQKEETKSSLQKAQEASDDTAVKKKKKRTLRPRKALITLSPMAISHLKGLLDQPEPKLIRIGVKNRGCSGLTYDLQYITEPSKFDEIVEQDGVKVVIDSKALFSIVGSEMDWVDDKLSSRFVFKNPNSKGTCGCGESFMV